MDIIFLLLAIGVVAFVLLVVARRRDGTSGVANPPLPNFEAQSETDLFQLLQEGKMIGAIKLHRKLYGSDLKSAKEAIERHLANLQGATRTAAPDDQPIGNSTPEDIDKLILAGRKIHAIKLHRSLFRTDLKSAKEAVEKRMKLIGYRK